VISEGRINWSQSLQRRAEVSERRVAAAVESWGATQPRQCSGTQAEEPLPLKSVKCSLV
jgi:hypothetical protein